MKIIFWILKFQQISTRWRLLLMLALSFLLSAVAFPEFILFHQVSFIWWNDYLIDYYSTFLLTSFLAQGHLGLWDLWGQMSHIFFFSTHGIFRIPNELCALVYTFLAPFTTNAGMLFHQVFSEVYVLSLLAIRAIGLYLLFGRLSQQRVLVIAMAAIGAVFFCQPAFVIGTFYQSCYPLLMYFILFFFESAKARHFASACLLLIVFLSGDIAHTCYLYLGMHFFILSCIGWALITGKGKAIFGWQHFIRFLYNHRLQICACLGLTLIILGPYVYMQVESFKEINFGLDQSRLKGMFDVGHYFHGLMLDQARPEEFLRSTVNFMYTPGMTFFFGFTLFFLGVVGLVLSKDSRKWIFALTLFFVWTLNFPRDTFNLGTLTHVINVLTDPIKAMVRSYHMATYSFLPYLLLAMAFIGLDALIVFFKRNDRLGRVVTITIALIVTFLIWTWSSNQPQIVKIYLFIIWLLSNLMLLIFSRAIPIPRYVAYMVLALMLIADLSLAAFQVKHDLRRSFLRPNFLSFATTQGPKGVDFQNPSLQAVTDRVDILPIDSDPHIWTVHDISGAMFHVINEDFIFRPADVHNPYHISLTGWFKNNMLGDYFSQNNRWTFVVKDAVMSKTDRLEEIIRKGLVKDIVALEGAAEGVLDQIPSQLQHRAFLEDQWSYESVDLPGNWQDLQMQDGKMFIWDFPLQVPLPQGFSTNIFTLAPLVRFFLQLDGRQPVELKQAQGWLTEPMSFDVSNIKEGKVFVALPTNLSFNKAKGMLFINRFSLEGLRGIESDGDRWNISYLMPYDGWAVIHVPYDKKWRVRVDGHVVKYYKANNAFIAFKLARGEHRVELSFWPETLLRPVLVLSALSAFICFFAIIYFALRRSDEV